MVRGVLLLTDHDVLGGRCQRKLRGHQARRRRHRSDQRNIPPLRADEGSHRRPAILGGSFPAHVVEAVRHPFVQEGLVRLRHRAARQSNGRRVEVRRLLGRRVEKARISYVPGARRDRIGGHRPMLFPDETRPSRADPVA